MLPAFGEQGITVTTLGRGAGDRSPYRPAELEQVSELAAATRTSCSP